MNKIRTSFHRREDQGWLWQASLGGVVRVMTLMANPKISQIQDIFPNKSTSHPKRLTTAQSGSPDTRSLPDTTQSDTLDTQNIEDIVDTFIKESSNEIKRNLNQNHFNYFEESQSDNTKLSCLLGNTKIQLRQSKKIENLYSETKTSGECKSGKIIIFNRFLLEESCNLIYCIVKVSKPNRNMNKATQSTHKFFFYSISIHSPKLETWSKSIDFTILLRSHEISQSSQSIKGKLSHDLDINLNDNLHNYKYKSHSLVKIRENYWLAPVKSNFFGKIPLINKINKTEAPNNKVTPKPKCSKEPFANFLNFISRATTGAESQLENLHTSSQLYHCILPQSDAIRKSEADKVSVDETQDKQRKIIVIVSFRRPNMPKQSKLPTSKSSLEKNESNNNVTPVTNSNKGRLRYTPDDPNGNSKKLKDSTLNQMEIEDALLAEASGGDNDFIIDDLEDYESKYKEMEQNSAQNEAANDNRAKEILQNSENDAATRKKSYIKPSVLSSLFGTASRSSLEDNMSPSAMDVTEDDLFDDQRIQAPDNLDKNDLNENNPEAVANEAMSNAEASLRQQFIEKARLDKKRYTDARRAEREAKSREREAIERELKQRKEFEDMQRSFRKLEEKIKRMQEQTFSPRGDLDSRIEEFRQRLDSQEAGPSTSYEISRTGTTRKPQNQLRLDFSNNSNPVKQSKTVSSVVSFEGYTEEDDATEAINGSLKELYEAFWVNGSQPTKTVMIIRPKDYPNHIINEEQFQALKAEINKSFDQNEVEQETRFEETGFKQGTMTVLCRTLGTAAYLVMLVASMEQFPNLECVPYRFARNLLPAFMAWVQEKEENFESYKRHMKTHFGERVKEWKLIRCYDNKPGTRFLFLGPQELVQIIEEKASQDRRRIRASGTIEFKHRYKAHNVPGSIYHLSNIVDDKDIRRKKIIINYTKYLFNLFKATMKSQERLSVLQLTRLCNSSEQLKPRHKRRRWIEREISPTTLRLTAKTNSEPLRINFTEPNKGLSTIKAFLRHTTYHESAELEGGELYANWNKTGGGNYYHSTLRIKNAAWRSANLERWKIIEKLKLNIVKNYELAIVELSELTQLCLLLLLTETLCHRIIVSKFSLKSLYNKDFKELGITNLITSILYNVKYNEIKISKFIKQEISLNCKVENVVNESRSTAQTLNTVRTKDDWMTHANNLKSFDLKSCLTPTNIKGFFVMCKKPILNLLLSAISKRGWGDSEYS